MGYVVPIPSGLVDASSRPPVPLPTSIATEIATDGIYRRGH